MLFSLCVLDALVYLGGGSELFLLSVHPESVLSKATLTWPGSLLSMSSRKFNPWNIKYVSAVENIEHLAFE